jgi:hypothetical protein
VDAALAAEGKALSIPEPAPARVDLAGASREEQMAWLAGGRDGAAQLMQTLGRTP